MGMFSWYTQDTNRQIVADKKERTIMTDDKGNNYVEDCYEGYGVFGGKDFYVLVAEMNGLSIEQFNDNADPLKALRYAGIELAFKDSPSGNNPNIIYPSLTEHGGYMDGIQAEIDPNQGWEDEEDDEEWFEDDEDDDWTEYDDDWGEEERTEE